MLYFTRFVSLAALVAVVTLSASTTLLAQQQLQFNMAFGEDWNDISGGSGNFWNDGLAPHAGATYLAGGAAPGNTIRTVNNANSTFQGDSLTIGPGGALAAKQNFTGTGSNSNVGTLILNGGTLSASSGTGGGSQQGFTGLLNVAANSTISLSGSSNRRLRWQGGTLTGSGNINMTGANNQNDIFFLNGTNGNSHTGSWTVTNGRLIAGGGNALGDTSAITINGGGNGALDVRGNETVGSLAGNGRIRIVSGGPYTLTTGGNNSSTTFSGIIQNALNIVKTGSGTFTLSGANTHTGTITVEQGNLLITNSGALGNASAGTTIQNVAGPTGGTGTALQLQGGIAVAEPITLAAGAGNHRVSIMNLSGNNTLSGPIAVSGSSLAQFWAQSGGLTVTGDITGAGFTNTLFLRGGSTSTLNVLSGTINIGTAQLGQTDGGLWTISSSGNTWGNTLLARGTLRMGANNALPSGTNVTMNQGGANNSTLDLNGFDQTVASVSHNLSGTGNQTVNTGSGNFTVTGSYIDNSAANSTLNVGGGSTTVIGTGLTVDNLTVANDGGTASITVNSGPVNIGGGVGNFLDLADTTSAPSANGIADFSGASSVTINVGNLRMGIGTDNSGSTRGELRLSAAGPNNVTATNLLMGDSNPAGNTGVTSEIILGGAANNFAVNQFSIAARKSNAEVSILSGGSFDLIGTSGAGSGTLDVARRAVNTGANTTGTLDLSAASQVDIDIAIIRVGTITTGGATGNPTGTILLPTAGNANVTANTVLLGDSPAHANSSVTQTLTLAGGTNNFAVNQFTIAGRKSVAAVDISPGGVFNLTGTGGAGTGTLDLSRRTVNTGVNSLGTLDLADASSVNINVATIRMGTITTGSGGGDSRGVWNFSNTTNTVSANTILVGDSPAAANTGTTSTILLGSGANNVNVNTWTVGGRKSKGEVTINPLGTLTLSGNTNARADLFIANNSVDTGTVSTGNVDLSGGTFNASIDELRVGRHQDGAGSGQGSLTFDAGTVNSNSVIIGHASTGGTNFSTNPTNTTGDVTQNGGAFEVNNSMTLGLNGAVGNYSANGGTVSVGDGGGSDNLFVGRRVQDVNAGGVNILSVMDLSGAFEFSFDGNQIGIGTVTGGGSGQTRPQGRLLLAASNDITANSILIADSPSVGLGGVPNLLELGNTNTISAGTITVGGSKGVGVMNFRSPGSTLDLNSAGSRGDLFVADQTVGTGGGSNGTVDFLGSTVNAFLDQLVAGRKPNAASGNTTGLMSFNGGTIDVNSVQLGVRTDAGIAGNVTGTMNQSGGTMVVNNNMDVGIGGVGNYNLTDGTLSFNDTASGTQDPASLTASTLSVNANSTFNFTGGQLENVTTIDVTGSANPFSQDGGRLVIGVDGGLAIDGSAERAITTIVGGDYDQNAGSLVIDIFGPGAHAGNGEAASIAAINPLDPDLDSDLLHVMGDAFLDGTLEINLNGFEPGPFHWYDVLLADGEIDVNDATFDVTGVNLFRVIDNPFGQGQLLQVAVPEPASLLIWGLIGLGLASFGYYRTRRKK